MKNSEEMKNLNEREYGDYGEKGLFSKNHEKEELEQMSTNKSDLNKMDSGKSGFGKMNFAENLQYLRKQKNITQEQLAERLEVSRQSVSKWESGQSYPEMEKLLQMCDMFHCDLNILMRGDISRSFAQDVHGYDKFHTQFNRFISAGVGLILLGISVMLMLNGFGMDEMLSGAVFFSFTIVGVMLFVVMGMQKSRFCQKHPVIEDFYTEDEKEQAYRSYTVRIATGVGIILIGFLLLMVGDARIEIMTDVMDAAFTERAESLLCSVFILMIAVAVTILVYGGLQKSKYDIKQYNAETNPSPEKKKRDALIGKLCACIMMTSVIIYLLISFLSESWKMSWIVFAVGGIVCGIVSVALSKEK